MYFNKQKLDIHVCLFNWKMEIAGNGLFIWSKMSWLHNSFPSLNRLVQAKINCINVLIYAARGETDVSAC